MLRRLVIRHYQSLNSIDLTVDGFTVIVGPSGSGKSSLVRALRLLVANARGSSYVERGAKRAGVVASFEDGTILALERGEGHGVYKLVQGGQEKRYTKLGGAVPDDVAEFLDLDPALSFAGQFDRPYLLDDSGQQVARVLGELTNVTTIFEAVREANRRRQASNGKLRTRQADLEAAKAELQQYRNLPEQLQAMQRTETLLDDVDAVERDLGLLRNAVQTYQVAQRGLDNYRVPLPVPNLEPIEEAGRRLADFKLALRSLVRQRQGLDQWHNEIARLDGLLATAHDQLHSSLADAGVCPTCGQSTKQLEKVS